MFGTSYTVLMKFFSTKYSKLSDFPLAGHDSSVTGSTKRNRKAHTNTASTSHLCSTLVIKYLLGVCERGIEPVIC